MLLAMHAQGGLLSVGQGDLVVVVPWLTCLLLATRFVGGKP